MVPGLDLPVLAESVVAEQFRLGRSVGTGNAAYWTERRVEMAQEAESMLVVLARAVAATAPAGLHRLSPIQVACFDELFESILGLERAPRPSSAHNQLELAFGVRIRRVVEGGEVAIRVRPFGRHSARATAVRYRPR